MSYTMYTPLNVWLDPASVTDVVAYIQTYLSENTIYSETEIETIIHDYLIAHPELIGGVQSVNGKTGTVVLSASDINTENNVTIESVLASLSSQISSIAANVATNTANITSLTGRVSTAETDLSNLKSNFYNGDASAVQNKYTVVVENPTEYAYTNHPIEIKVNFEKGVCRGKNYILVKDANGLEKPYSFIPCSDENLFVNADYTYYDDRSIHCATLLILDSINASTSNVYTVETLATPHADYTQNVTSLVTGTGHNRLVASHVTLNFNKDSHFRLNTVLTSNKNYFPDLVYGVISNGTTINESASNFETATGLLSVDHSFDGDGVNYLDFVRVLNFSDYKFKQITRLYANNRFDCFSAVMFNADHTGETRHFIKMSFSVGATLSSESNNSAEMYKWLDSSNNVTQGFTPLYCNANSQRDVQTLPIYTPVYSLTGVGTTTLTITLGWQTSNTNTWYKGFALTSLFTWVYDSNTNDVYRIFNNLNGMIAKNRVENMKSTIKQSIKPYINTLSNIFLNDAGSEMAIRHLKPYCKMAEYLNENIGFDEVENSFKTMINDVFGGPTESDIESGYNTFGLTYIGRSLPLSYHLFKRTNDAYYSTIIKSYADFIVSLFNSKNDIPLKTSENAGNESSRTSGMVALAMAINLGLDTNSTYLNTFNSIDSLVNSINVVGTILPEGNIISSRYLHYTAYANYFEILAHKLANVPSLMTSQYNYMFDSCHPSGEIKDLTYLSSDSRRGLLHTYSYVLATLALTENPGAVYMAKNSVDWINDQIPVWGSMPAQADKYDTYPKSQNAFVFNMGFAITPLVDICLL